MTDAQQWHYPSTSVDDGPGPVRQAAPEGAQDVARTAVDAGSGLAATTRDESQQIVKKAGNEAKGLYHRARAEVTDQASAQQKRAAGGLHAFSDEAMKMADQGAQSGPATQIARQAADRAAKAAHWLEQREPGDLIEEIKGYARRNPGMFLMGAAALGIVAGRLTKGLAAGSDEDGSGWNGGAPETESRAMSQPISRQTPDAALLGDGGGTPVTPRQETYIQPGIDDLGVDR